jgi:probable phosphoglycerate mutase
LLERHAGQKIVIAAHGESIEASHALLLELPLMACTRISFRTDHSSLTRWERHTNRFDRTVWMLAAHNDTTHLAT